MTKPSVFLSYSHKDEDWKNRLRTQLKVLEQVGTLVVWDDRKIDAGETWYDEIRVAMDDAKVAVCLISSDYLASDFCVKEEIPYLLKRRSEQGMRLVPVLLRPCPWKYVPWLKAIQMLPRDGKAVAVDFAATWDVAFDEVAESIAGGFEEPATRGEVVRSPPDLGRGSIVRSLPMAPGSFDLELAPRAEAPRELFGRAPELNWLDGVRDKGTVRIVSLTGPAGIGKSALIDTWLHGSKKKDGRGRTIQVVADAETRPGLAQFVRSGDGNGRLLVLISRKPLPELDGLPESQVARMELRPLPPAAGRALLRVSGVRGTDAELEAISQELGGVPRALLLRAGR